MEDRTINFSNKLDTSKIITYDFTPNKALDVGKNVSKEKPLIDNVGVIYPSKTIQMDKVDYKVNKAYFTAPFFDMDKNETIIDIDGILVLEHSNSSNEALYFCIPIKHQKGSNTSSVSHLIDVIINEGGTIPFNLEQDLYNELQVAYYEKNSGKKQGHYILLDTIIYVPQNVKLIENSDTEISDINLNHADLKHDDYTGQNVKILKFHSDDQIYIDCNPTGESPETIAAYNIPINSEYANTEKKGNFERQAVYSGFFAFVLLLTYFFVPFYYKTYIIESIVNWYDDDKMDGALQYVDEKGKKNDLKNYYSAELRISAINKFIFILAGLYITTNLIYGIIEKSNDFIIAMYAAAWFSVAVFSIIVKGEGKMFFNHVSEINPDIQKQLYGQYYSEGHSNEFDDINSKYGSMFSLLTPFMSGNTLEIPNWLWICLIIAAVIVNYTIIQVYVFGQKTDETLTKVIINAILYSIMGVTFVYSLLSKKPIG